MSNEKNNNPIINSMKKVNELNVMLQWCERLGPPYIEKFVENLVKNDNNFVGFMLTDPSDPNDTLEDINVVFSGPPRTNYAELGQFLMFAKVFARRFYTVFLAVIKSRPNAKTFMDMIDPSKTVADFESKIAQSLCVHKSRLDIIYPALAYVTSTDSMVTQDLKFNEGFNPIPFNKPMLSFEKILFETFKQVEAEVIKGMLTEDSDL